MEQSNRINKRKKKYKSKFKYIKKPHLNKYM